MGKLNYKHSTDAELSKKMSAVWDFAAGLGIIPVIIIAGLPSGDIVDMSDPKVCNKCIGLFLQEVAEAYTAEYPEHADDDKEVKHMGFGDN